MTQTEFSLAKERSAKKENDYDLKISRDKIGALVPILKDAHGNLIDGFHRKNVDDNWPSLTIENIKDPLQLAIARLVVNVQRRKPEEDTEDKNEIRNLLSKIAELTKWTPKEIAENIGMKEWWVYKWLPDEYKPNIVQRTMESISGTEEILAKEPQIKPFQFKPKSFTVWNFKGCDIHFGIPNFPGQIPGDLVVNVLHFFTLEADLVDDPMAGSGTTYDACKMLNRNCLCYDIAPIRPEIKKWNVEDGFPKETFNCDLIFLDPPYFQKNKGKYTTKENPSAEADSCSEYSKEQFMNFMRKLSRDCYETVRPKGIVALLISDYIDNEHSLLTTEYYNYFWSQGFRAINRIQCPLSTQQYKGHEVKRANEKRKLLNISRDLYIFKKV